MDEQRQAKSTRPLTTATERGLIITYFTDNIRNVHTCRAYHRWVLYFFDWCDHKGLDFQAVQSFHVSTFIEGLLSDQAQEIVPDKRDPGPYGKSSVKQAVPVGHLDRS